MPEKQKPVFDATAYWNERYRTIDVTKSGHIDLPAAYNVWLYRRKQRNVAKAVAKAGGSMNGNKLLEVAAGSGAWMDFWKRQGVADYIGIDLSERAVAGLRLSFPKHRFLQRDINDSELAKAVGNGYDSVSAIDALYHVMGDKQFSTALVELASVLKPGGLLIIHDQFLHGPARDHGYLKWRSIGEYVYALDAAGFEILCRRPTFFFMIQTVDFKGFPAKFMEALWTNVTYPFIRRFPGLAGAMGYALDTAICTFLREGPSMEIMICRKCGRVD